MNVITKTASSTSSSAVSKFRSVFCVAFRPKVEVLWLLWHTEMTLAAPPPPFMKSSVCLSFFLCKHSLVFD